MCFLEYLQSCATITTIWEHFPPDQSFTPISSHSSFPSLTLQQLFVVLLKKIHLKKMQKRMDKLAQGRTVTRDRMWISLLKKKNDSSLSSWDVSHYLSKLLTVIQPSTAGLTLTPSIQIWVLQFACPFLRKKQPKPKNITKTQSNRIWPWNYRLTPT